MIPLKLELKNFLSYGGDSQEIDFSAHSLICLTGKNGHGKSAILDGITWALWGQARKPSGNSKPDEALLKVGQNKMLVLLDFLVGDVKYRVRREFSKVLSKSTANLDFFIWNEFRRDFLPLSEKTIRQTQQKINQTLRIDFETFVNSSFLRQGNANEFSKKNPRERKNLLAKIIGLEKFDLMQQKTSEMLKDVKSLQKELENKREKDVAKIASLPEQMNKKNELDEKLTQLLELIKQATSFKGLLDEKKSMINAEIAEIKKHIETKKELEMQKDLWRKKFFENCLRARNLFFEIISIKQSILLVDDQVKIEQNLKNAEELFLHKNVLIQKRLTLQEKLNYEKSILAKNQSDFYNLIHQDSQNILLKLEKEKTTREMLQKQICETNDKINTLSDQLNKYKDSDDFIIDFEILEKELQVKKAVHKNKLSKFNERLMSLKKKVQHEQNCLNMTICPFCDEPFTKNKEARISKKIILHNHQINRLIIFLDKEHKVSASLEADLVQLSLKIKNSLFLKTTISQFENDKNILDEVLKKLLAAEVVCKLDLEKIREELLQLELKKESALKSEQDVIKNKICPLENEVLVLTKEIDLLGDVEKKYDLAKKDYANLQMIVQKKNEFLSLEKEKKILKNHRLELKIMCKNIANNLLEIEKKLTKTEKLKSEFLTLKKEWETNVEVLSNFEKDRQALLQSIAIVNAEVLLLQALQQEVLIADQKILMNKDELFTLEVLVEAFGKNGIQAILIEEILPQIEVASNQILDLISETHAKIFIEPLKDLKGGGMKESLDIIISDQNGIRDYEMFSGGEAFRIDFALRVGISQVIASRAGTPLKTLIIDEGFGALDEEGVALIMNCIYKISQLFSKIIVVSHLPALKEMFPVHIFVEKVAGASKISMEYRG